MVPEMRRRVVFFSPICLSSLGRALEEAESPTEARWRFCWAASAEGQRNEGRRQKLQDKVNCKGVMEVR